MGDAYWGLEYAKVFAAYLFVMFVYPSVVFRSYLKGKGKAFRFSFCVCVQIMLVSSTVLFLGLFHILNVWALRILFYGSFLWALSRMYRMPMTPRYLVYKVTNRTYSGKLLGLHIRNGIANAIRRAVRALWNSVKHNLLEILVLLALTIYGVAYFSIGPLQIHGYGFSDMPVHHSWIYGISQGKVFSGGIYPEAMHCFVYAVSALFGIELYNVLLFLQCANIITFFVSAYLLARELFRWRGTALVMLAVFLTFKLDSNSQIDMISRFQATLPQEFCLYTVYLIPAFLLRYLKNAKRVIYNGRRTKFCWDENLVVFCLAIAVSLAAHFYATMMAVFTCLAVVIVWFGKAMNPRRFVPLAVSAILALVMACAPMALAYAEGVPLQGSLYWALRVMQPREETELAVPVAVSPDPGDETAEGEEVTAETLNAQAGIPVVQEELPVVKKSLRQRAEELYTAVKEKLEYNWNGLYFHGYRILYETGTADYILLVSLLSLALFAGWHIVSGIFRWLFRWKWAKKELFDGYLMVTIMTVFFFLLFSARSTDFPVLIEINRVCTINHMIVVSLALIPVDFVGAGLGKIVGAKLSQVLSAAAVMAACILIYTSGNFHGYMYLLTSRFDSAVDVTNSIITEFPRWQFTIVSPTDELYHAIEYGFHEESLSFVQNCSKREYYIPTPYIFFYVEKNPIRYGSQHFPSGPEWLGNSSYNSSYYYANQGDDYYTGTASDEKADDTLYIGSKLSNAYVNIYNREIVESRMARYLRSLQTEYPNEMNVYFEDDNFICYVLKQNPNSLINFGNRKA